MLKHFRGHVPSGFEVGVDQQFDEVAGFAAFHTGEGFTDIAAIDAGLYQFLIYLDLGFPAFLFFGIGFFKAASSFYRFNGGIVSFNGGFPVLPIKGSIA